MPPRIMGIEKGALKGNIKMKSVRAAAPKRPTYARPASCDGVYSYRIVPAAVPLLMISIVG